MSSYMTKEITTALKDYYVRANETERIILNGGAGRQRTQRRPSPAGHAPKTPAGSGPQKPAGPPFIISLSQIKRRKRT